MNKTKAILARLEASAESHQPIDPYALILALRTAVQEFEALAKSGTDQAPAPLEQSPTPAPVA